MAGLALPKFRWLLAGGLAAGVWVVSQEKDVPRPPERVPLLKSVVAAPSRPAIALPKRVERPPPRPEKIVTGSISKPDRPRILRTTTAVNLRQRPDVGSPVLRTLAGGSRVRDCPLRQMAAGHGRGQQGLGPRRLPRRLGRQAAAAETSGLGQFSKTG